MTGADLKALRKQLRLTQRELGEAIQVHRHTIRIWETGKRPFPVKAQTAAKRIAWIVEREQND